MNDMNDKTGDMGNPWEKRNEIGLFKSIIETIKMLLLNPKDFFDHLHVSDSHKEPYLFYLCVQIPVMIIGFMEEIFIFQPMPA